MTKNRTPTNFKVFLKFKENYVQKLKLLFNVPYILKSTQISCSTAKLSQIRKFKNEIKNLKNNFSCKKLTFEFGL